MTKKTDPEKKVTVDDCICGSWPADGMYLKDCPWHDPKVGGIPPKERGEVYED